MKAVNVKGAGWGGIRTIDTVRKYLPAGVARSSWDGCPDGSASWRKPVENFPGVSCWALMRETARSP